MCVCVSERERERERDRGRHTEIDRDRESERGVGERQRGRERVRGEETQRERDGGRGGGLCVWMNRRVSEGNYSEEEVIKRTKESHSKKARASVARPRQLSQINPQQYKS